MKRAGYIGAMSGVWMLYMGLLAGYSGFFYVGIGLILLSFVLWAIYLRGRKPGDCE